MKSLVALSVHNIPFVNVLMRVILIGGFGASAFLVREMFPAFSADMIQVTVLYLGADPEDVEEGICRKLEEAIEGIENAKKYSTTASEGVGSAMVEIQEGADIQTVKDEVSEKVNAITTFPTDAERPIVTELKLRRPVLQIALAGNLTERQIKELAEDIKKDIETLPHISQVSVGGTRDYEIAVEVSEERLREYGLTFGDVSRAIRRGSMNLPGGTVRGENEEIKIRTLGRRYTGEEFASLVVLSKPDGTLIRLDQIASIRDEFEEEGVYGTFNGKRAAIISVLKTEDEDAIAISKEVKEYIRRTKGILPPTVTLTPWADYSIYVQQRLEMLLRNGRMGLILVFIILWMFLDIRLSFWVTMGIPISIAGALGLMALSGMTLNMMTLFALIMIIGIIVDDAIVVGESIYIKRRQGLSPIQASLEGVAEVAWPITAAVTTTLCAFLPLMFVGGVMGKFIKMLPQVVIWALSVSLFESLFLLPAHLSHLPDMNRPESELSPLARRSFRIRRRVGTLLEWFTKRIYAPAITLASKFRYVTIALAIALLLLTFGMIAGGFIKYTVFPKMDSDTMTARVEFPDGTPLQVTRQAVERIEAALMKLDRDFQKETGQPLVLSRYAIAGSFTGAEGFSGSHLGEVSVEMLESKYRKWHYRDIVAVWEKEVGAIVGALSNTYQGLQAGPGGKDIEIWLTGDRIEDLLAASSEIERNLRETAGVFEIENDFRPGKRELRARLKPGAEVLGITTDMLAEQLRSGYYGSEAVRIQRGRDDIRVKVRYPLAERRSLGDVEKIRIRTATGQEVPLMAVADVSLEVGYTRIQRQNGKRRVIVTAETRPPANANEIMDFLQHSLLPALTARYPGVRYSAEGSRQTTREALGSLKYGFPVAILGIFLILATEFRSYFQPIVIMVTIPFGLIGAAFGHLLLGYEITMMSMFGMVALAGIVVNDAIVFIDCFNERLRQGLPFIEALREGGMRRLQPILLTTSTTVAGLAPLIMEKSFQAQFLIPMAVSIASGLIFATLLTLFFIPCLLVALNDLRRLWRLLWTGSMPTREAVEPAITLRVEDHEPFVESKVRDYGV